VTTCRFLGQSPSKRLDKNEVREDIEMPHYKTLLRTSLCVALLIFSNFTTSANPIGSFYALMSAVQEARSGEPVLPTPTLSLSASTESALIGAAFTLSWSSIHATNCSASGSWSGDK